MTRIFTDVLESSNYPGLTELIACADLNLTLTLELLENGECILYADKSENERYVTSVSEIIKSYWVALEKSDLLQEAKQRGNSLEEYLNYLGVSSVAEHLENELGVTLDKLLEEYMLENQEDFLSLYNFKGIYKVQDGTITIIYNSKVSSADYDFNSETLTINNDDYSWLNFYRP